MAEPDGRPTLLALSGGDGASLVGALRQRWGEVGVFAGDGLAAARDLLARGMRQATVLAIAADDGSAIEDLRVRCERLLRRCPFLDLHVGGTCSADLAPAVAASCAVRGIRPDDADTARLAAAAGQIAGRVLSSCEPSAHPGLLLPGDDPWWLHEPCLRRLDVARSSAMPLRLEPAPAPPAAAAPAGRPEVDALLGRIARSLPPDGAPLAACGGDPAHPATIQPGRWRRWSCRDPAQAQRLLRLVAAEGLIARRDGAELLVPDVPDAAETVGRAMAWT